MAIKYRSEVLNDPKAIYTAPSKLQAEVALAHLGEKWGKQYPTMVNSWLNNWEELSNYFKYPKEITENGSTPPLLNRLGANAFYRPFTMHFCPFF